MVMEKKLEMLPHLSYAIKQNQKGMEQAAMVANSEDEPTLKEALSSDERAEWLK